MKVAEVRNRVTIQSVRAWDEVYRRGIAKVMKDAYSLVVLRLSGKPEESNNSDGH